MGRIRRGTRARSLPAVGPWSRRLLVGVVVADLISFLVLVVVWYRISGQLYGKETIVWMDLGAIALIASGTAHALWLVRGRGRLRAGRRAVIQAVAPDHLAALASDRRALRAAMRGSSPRSVTDRDAATALVIVRGIARFHRPGCAFVADRSTEAVEPGSTGDFEACEVCRP